MPKIGEKWAEHHQKMFGGKIGSKVFQKKKATFLPISGRNLAENVKKRGFWRPRKFSVAEISGHIGRKTTFVEKIFFQFLVNHLAHIH